MEQLSLLKERRTSYSNREKRSIVMTARRIGYYEYGLKAAIREHETMLMRSQEPESVKDVYRSIIETYKEELKYLGEILWEGEDTND